MAHRKHMEAAARVGARGWRQYLRAGRTRDWIAAMLQLSSAQVQADIAGSGFAITGYTVHEALGGDVALVRQRLRQRGLAGGFLYGKSEESKKRAYQQGVEDGRRSR